MPPAEEEAADAGAEAGAVGAQREWALGPGMGPRRSRDMMSPPEPIAASMESSKEVNLGDAPTERPGGGPGAGAALALRDLPSAPR